MQTDVKSDVEERMLWESREMGLLPWRYLFTSDVIAEDWFAPHLAVGSCGHTAGNFRRFLQQAWRMLW